MIKLFLCILYLQEGRIFNVMIDGCFQMIGKVSPSFRNVSKHNYCFSDFPFGDEVPDFPHHKDMADYIKRYSQHFGINDVIKFQREVTCLQQQGKQHTIFM